MHRHALATLVAVAAVGLLLLQGCSAPSGSAVPAVTVVTTTATAVVTTTQVGPTVTLHPLPSVSTVTVATTIRTTATATKTLSATVTRTAAASTTQVAAAVVWSSDSEQVAGAPAPQFPATLPNWRISKTWDTVTRAFSGQWSSVAGPDGGDFPSTMNGCDDQRFLLRWRAVDSSAQVDAGLADAADSTDDVTTDSSGWMAFDSCQHPQVRFHGDSNQLTDVAVSVQQYVPAA